MKRTLAIFIISVFFCNICGYLLVYPVLSGYYKKMGLEESQNPGKEGLVELIVIKKSDIKNRQVNLKWIHSREFKLNNEMYDIVKQSEDDEYFYFYCINDEKEKNLEKNFEDKLCENSSNNKYAQSVHQNILISTVPIAYTLQNIKIKKDFSHNSSFINRYKSITTEIITPPPQIT